MSIIKKCIILSLAVQVSLVQTPIAHASSVEDLSRTIDHLQETINRMQNVPNGEVLGIDTSSLSYPTLDNPQGLSDPSLALGLNGVEDWSVQMPFINIFKTARTWIGHLPNQFGGVETEELEAAGVFDEHGWPTYIPSNVSHIGTIWDWSSNNEYGQEESRRGRYVLTYKGQGTILMSGVSILEQTPGRILFDNTDGSTFSVDIVETDPNNTGSYINDIVIVKEDNLSLYNAGAIFNPEWIDIVKDVRMVRFMDWMGTNGSQVRTWSEYSNEETYTWTQQVPVSVMVELANEIGADPWFNIPFNTNDNFSRTFAEYVKANLDEDLVAHVELSNEVWNFIFPQTHDAVRYAEEAYGVTGGTAWLNYYGQRASEVMKIWTSVFANQTQQRLKRVAGAFTPIPYFTEEILTAPLWEQSNPGEYHEPVEYFDAIAVTTYFGAETITDDSTRAALLEAINNPNIDENNYHRDLLIEAVQNGDEFNAQKAIADNYNLDLLSYEGGQHVHHSAGTDLEQDEIEALQDHLASFVRSQQMADVYAESYETWQEYGSGPFMQFVDVSAVSAYGSWGLLASLQDSTPRSEYLFNKNSEDGAWWEDRSGTEFQNGRTVIGTNSDNVLSGTIVEDFIMGGAGEDVIYPGEGNDGINGGADEDVVMLRGSQSDYTVTLEGVGYRVVGPDGSDYMYAVEILYFEDGSTMELDVTIIPSDPELPPTGNLSDFSTGDQVVTNDRLNVRSTAHGAVVGIQETGAIGIVQNHTAVSVAGYVWIYVQFSSGANGWVADEFLSEYVAPDPVPTPTPDPIDTLTKNVRNYIFGHSLINHEHVANQPFTEELAVPHWLNALAQEAGNTYAVDGQYGFMTSHANTLPPDSSWDFDDVPHVWDSGSGSSFASADFTTVMFTPANFIQWQEPTAPYYDDPRSPVEATLEVIDWVANREADIDFIVYQNWPDMGQYVDSFPASASEFATYNNYTQHEWVQWWDTYLTLLQDARPNENIRMIPVGSIVSKVLTETVANQLSSAQLYEDDAPHGRPTLYFIASLVTYMGMYGEKAPDTFQVPSSIEPVVRNNYQTIVDYIWNELDYQNENPVPPVPVPTPVPDPELPPTGNLSDFSTGDQVVTNDRLNVRSTAHGAVVGIQETGAIGIVQNHTAVSVAGYVWIYVQFSSGANGWVADEFLSEYVAPDPVPTPEPEPEPEPEPGDYAPVAVNDYYVTLPGVPVYQYNVMTNDSGSGSVLSVLDRSDVPGDNGGIFNIDVDGRFYFETNDDFSYLQPGQSEITSIGYTLTEGGTTDVARLHITVIAPSEESPQDPVIENPNEPIAPETEDPVEEPVEEPEDVNSADASDDYYITRPGGPVYLVNVLTNDTVAPGAYVDHISNRTGSNGGSFNLDTDGFFYFETNGDFANLSQSESVSTSIEYTLHSQGDEDVGTITVTVTQGVAPFSP